MIIISHRGNIDGPSKLRENNPKCIKELLNQNIPVEIDVRYSNGFWLGHDKRQYKISQDFLVDNRTKLWIHCKTPETLEYFNTHLSIINMNYFYHNNDNYTLTSQKIIWCHPKAKPLRNSVFLDFSSNPNYSLDVYGLCVDKLP